MQIAYKYLLVVATSSSSSNSSSSNRRSSSSNNSRVVVTEEVAVVIIVGVVVTEEVVTVKYTESNRMSYTLPFPMSDPSQYSLLLPSSPVVSVSYKYRI
jgi:hypothetical protein